MVAIQIRDVPDDVREALAGEARRRGQSLQLFLAEVLAREAASARNLAWLARIRENPIARVPGTVSAGTRESIRETWEERDRDIAAAIAARSMAHE